MTTTTSNTRCRPPGLPRASRRPTSSRPGPMSMTTTPNRCPFTSSTHDPHPLRPGTAHLSNRGAVCSMTTAPVPEVEPIGFAHNGFHVDDEQRFRPIEEFSPPPRAVRGMSCTRTDLSRRGRATGTTAPIRTTPPATDDIRSGIISRSTQRRQPVYPRPSRPRTHPAPPHPPVRRAGNRSTSRHARSLPHTVRG